MTQGLSQIFPAKQGVPGAPVGTTEWADSVRVTAIKGIREPQADAKMFKMTYDLMSNHRAWTLMNKIDGSFFSSFEEFCETAVPHGLGTPPDKVRKVLEIAASQAKVTIGSVQASVVASESVALATVSPASLRVGSTANQDRDNAGRLLPVDPAMRQYVAQRDRAEDKKNERLRRALNAPADAQNMLRAGLIGKVEAAALGPTRQTPETAAKIREAVNEAVAIVTERKPETPKEKREVKRLVNKRVREVLGAPVRPSTFGDLLARINKLPSDDRTTLVCGVIEHLDAVHFHRIREALAAREES